MEARLKEDTLRESEHCGGAIMVIHETEDGQIFDSWEHVNSDSVQTPLEVFQCLEDMYGRFPIKYAQVPITDGKAPKSSDFDTMATNIATALKDTALVFNCQVTNSHLNVFYCNYCTGFYQRLQACSSSPAVCALLIVSSSFSPNWPFDIDRWVGERRPLGL